MKSLFTMIEMLILFTLMTLFSFSAHAISVQNQGLKPFNVEGINCKDGLKCENVQQKLKLSAYHAAVITFASGDATPSVASGTWFNTFTNTQTITALTGGVAGKEIIIESKAAVTFDVTGTTLKCGSTDIITASGDMSRWLFDGTNWKCLSRIKAAGNQN